MRILGIDPGIDRCGWAIVENNFNSPVALAYSCLSTSKNLVMSQRLVQLYDAINKLCKTHTPSIIAMEDLFFNTNAKTAMIVGQARGVIMLAAEKTKIPLFSYPPLEIKMAITGYGRAEKEQIQQMVKNILHLTSLPKPDDTADALAVALTYCLVNKFKSQLKTI